jgi:outer membrane protein OmpA-like peptidoglycan-associated protein
MNNKVLITALLTSFSLLAQAQESGKSKSSTKNYEKSADKRQGVELWNCSNINTPRTEFAPALYQYGLVFASSEKNGPIDEKTGEPYFQLYYAETDRNHIPMSPRSYSMEANSRFHEGGVTFGKRGNIMYYSSNNQQNGYSVADKKGVTRMKIYEAERGTRDWENIVELPFNNDKYTCFHPTLSADGRTLYFSSDMPGGFGGFDLYAVEKKGNTWSKPVNLGAKINSDSDEAFPFIHDSGVLFYASKGFKGIGGFDIYKIDLTKAGVSPKNLGEPFNSNADDFGLILNSDGDVGYLASNREGGFGKDDIYLFRAEKRLTAETVTINGLIAVKDAATDSRVEGAAVRIFEKNSQGFLVGANYYDVNMTTGANGKDLKLETVRKAAEQLGVPDRITTSNGEAQYEMKNDREYLILISKEGYETKELIYNTFDKTNGLAFIDVVLAKLAKPQFKAAVLSEKYNTAIPNALVKITNTTTQKTESFYTNNNGVFNFTPELNSVYSLVIEKEGYKSATHTFNIGADATKLEQNFALMPIEPTIVNKPIEQGTVIVLDKIYYDFDKAFIRQGAASELDGLASLMMQYQSMEIELVAHTDSRGNSDYNQKLSEQRAISAKNYLAAKGIAENRIKAKGAGESQIRNQCQDGVNCSEEQHQYNRRTEVKVTAINETAVKVQYQDKGPEVINGKND